jgi:hypothetical protein
MWTRQGRSKSTSRAHQATVIPGCRSHGIRYATSQPRGCTDKLITQNSTSERFIAHVKERGGPGPLADMFIRTKCGQGRDILAQGASNGALDYDALLALAAHLEDGLGKTGDLDVAWLLQLARVVALQNGPAGLESQTPYSS